MSISNELQIGKAGEYIVCADIIIKGLVCYPSEQGLPYDVVIDNGSRLLKCQETPLYSDTLKVAGRVDLIAEYDGQLSIIDFKTARRRKSREEIDCYFQQTAAYAIMFEELTGIPIHNIVILMAVDNSPTPIIFKEKTKDWVKPLYDTIESYYTLNI